MADVIKNFPSRLHKMTQVFYREVPSQVATRRFIDTLTNLLFPVRDKRNISLKEMDLKWENLQHDFLEIISPLCADMDCCCEHLTERFFGEIPLIYTRLMQDANLYKNCDPAAYCTEEVILCYPGFYAVMVYRLSHVLHKLKIPVLPRVISEYAHSQTGIDIHPGATIGPNFYIDHGTGIVIGETTVIGRNVKIYQGVTLGALSTRGGQRLAGVKRHPTIEDNVTIYSNASVLGGETVVGAGSVVAGSTFVTSSVPPNSRVSLKAQEITVRQPGERD